MMKGIGIIGMGAISHYYVEGFNNTATCALVAVCDLAPAKLDRFAGTETSTYLDYQQLLKDPRVGGVVINLPNNLHYQACLDALAAGKHVCCEKPLTLSLEQAEILSAKAREAGLGLLTAFHRRYNLHLVAACRQNMFSRQANDVKAVHAHYDERIEDHTGADAWYLNPAACGGGCIADNGPNIFDSLSFALGHLELVDADARYDKNGLDVGAKIRLRTGDGMQVTAHLSWDYAHGERKDLVVEDSTGTLHVVDLLKDSVGFKTSLYHEYEGVLAHFCRVIEGELEFGEGGVDAVRLVSGCYDILTRKRHAERENGRNKTKLPLTGRLIKTLHHSRTERGMRLIEHASRCIRAGEVHELVSTDQPGLEAGDVVDRVGFIGFMEAGCAGVIERGDSLLIGGEAIGTVVGFDECHYPNHYNILVATAQLRTAADIVQAAPGANLLFEETA